MTSKDIWLIKLEYLNWGAVIMAEAFQPTNFLWTVQTLTFQLISGKLPDAKFWLAKTTF